MRTVKIGFIPSHRSTFAEDWAVKMRLRCLEQMQAVEGLEVVVPDEQTTKSGLVQDLADAQACLELFQREKFAGIILGGMNFGSETAAVGGIIAKLPGLPVLQFATKGALIGKDGLRASDAWCGQFMLTSAMKRRGIKFEHLQTCFPEEPVFRHRIDRFVRACMANAGFRGARIGQLGIRPEQFESVWADEAALQRQFDQTVVPLEMERFFDQVEAIPADDPEVVRTVAEVSAGADVSGLPEGTLAMLARYEVGLLRLAEEKQLQAVAVNCWRRVQQRLGISVCSALGRITDRGLMCACEVDIYGAATMLAAYLTGKTEVAPHFIDWTELHPTEPNVFLAWHCGNAPPSLCAYGCWPRLEQHSLMQSADSHGALEFRLKEGPVTCCRLVEYGGEFTMFIGQGAVLNIGPTVRGASAWVKVADLLDWEKLMVENGVIHHGVLIHDPQVADALASFCYFNNIRVVIAP